MSEPCLLRQSIRQATDQLGMAQIGAPDFDARLLIGEALGLSRLDLVMQAERVITSDEQTTIAALINRRASREPVARILGQREFWGLPFGLNEATLEPRPDSETLVETALALAPAAQRLLDLGTGTGCLLLSLLHDLPAATGLGLDIAPRAVMQAQRNAQALDLEQRATFRINDWLTDLTEQFDLIVSNPPYIASADIATLMPEVKAHDPVLALDGGVDGLAPYRKLIPDIARCLTPGGYALFEVGYDQAVAVSDLLQQAGLHQIRSHRDLGGVARCVSARLL